MRYEVTGRFSSIVHYDEHDERSARVEWRTYVERLRQVKKVEATVDC